MKVNGQALTQDLIGQLFDSHTPAAHTIAAAYELDSLRLQNRIDTARFALSLAPRDAEAPSRAPTVLRLLRTPRRDRAAIARACQPLTALPPDQRINAVHSVLNTPAQFRINHAHRLLAAYMFERAPDAHRYLDGRTENVMEAQSIQRVSLAVRLLIQATPPPPPRVRQLANIEQYIRALCERASEAQQSIVMRVRGGDTEQRNALRVLRGSARPGDFSRALWANDAYTLDDGSRIGLGDLAALVWFVINRRANEAHTDDLMRYAFFLALAQCIEDDGHRVCGVGFTQRLMRILQGYVPGVVIDDPVVNPQAYVTHVTRQWARQLDGEQPSTVAIRAFYDEHLRTGTMLYAEHSPQVRILAEHLGAYLDLTYEGWRCSAPEDARAHAAR